jgi:hypothetical protein
MSIKNYTKYGFHTATPYTDETEAFSMLVSEKGRVMFAKNNNETLFYHSLNFRKYVQGSVKNGSEETLKEFDLKNISKLPRIGEHLALANYFGRHTEITELVITEIDTNFQLDSDLINGKYKK